MKKTILALIFVFSCALNMWAQSATKGFSNLSAPEKRWVIFHPFIAKKIFHCASRARFVTDSLKTNAVLKDGNGGQLDAFRHAYWMALLVQRFSAETAKKIGDVHEKGNYKDFLKGNLEDSIRPDSMMSVMDLKNNSTGIEIGLNFKNDTSSIKLSMEKTVIDAVKGGKLVVMKKTPDAFYLNATGRIIDLSNYHGKWYVPKCIVRSDYIMQPVNENSN